MLSAVEQGDFMVSVLQCGDNPTTDVAHPSDD